jgi:aminomethyltransferase
MLGTEGKKTALFARHLDLGAKMVPFGGFLMPLQYSGQIEEHEAVRGGIGMFDLSHMGEFRLTGPGAMAAADALLTNRILGTEPGQATYSPMCQEDGGIVDDLIVYHLPDSVLLVVNAANIAKDEAWVREHLPRGVEFRNESDATALIAVQGPDTEGFLSPLADVDLTTMGTYTALAGQVAGVRALISRTGYTGEDGFELYVAAEDAEELWERLFGLGRARGVLPVGLAARDTLRFEMGYCLYGNDIDDTTNPLEAGLGWTVKLDKNAFIGREALVRVEEDGVARRLVGLRPDSEKVIPRKDYSVLDGATIVGRITSGSFAPSLGRGLGMGYVAVSRCRRGSRLTIDIRGRWNEAEVTRMPFYTRGSRKAPGNG